MNWGYIISEAAQRTLYTQKIKKGDQISHTSEILKLTTYLEEREVVLENLFKENVNPENWQEFCQLTLVHIIVINRRRVGEVQRLQVKDFRTRRMHYVQDEIEKSLTPVEKYLASSLRKIDIQGKRSRMVLVLLIPVMEANIVLLLKIRAEVEISNYKPFVFANINSSTNSCLRGSDVLRKFSAAPGTKNPHLLTSTKLRKHCNDEPDFKS